MEYRIDRQGLLNELSAWDGFLKRRVRLIACGGTAMTLLGVKASTKDIDLIVPDEGERTYLIKIIEQLGYKPVSGWGWSKDGGFIFDLFRGKFVHTNELLESPLEEGNNILFKEFSHIYLGILNYYDIVISKLFRGDAVDNDDCLALLKSKGKEIDMVKLDKRFWETASYHALEDKVIKNWEHFQKLVKKGAI